MRRACLLLTMLIVCTTMTVPSLATVEPAPTRRVAGGNRIGTAIALSQQGWESADAVVLVRADEPADAVAGGMLADFLDAPMLLSSGIDLSPGVAEEVARLGASRVVIIGGPAAIGEAVSGRLAGEGRSVERVWGRDRFATAVAVSEAIAAQPEEFLLAVGAHTDPRRAWPDAVAAGAVTVLDGSSPLLLTAPDRLPAVTRERLLDAGVWVSLVGGPAAVSADIEAELAATLPRVTRFAGEDRYGTSRAIVDVILDGGVSEAPHPLIIASGENFPDALAASAFAARVDGLLILVPPGGMEPGGEHAAWLMRNRRRFSTVIAVGGTAALSEAVVQQVAAAIAQPTIPPPEGELVLPRVGQMGSNWEESFVIGYGDEEALLGTLPYGDGSGLQQGPEYGAQAPDGTWWFVDTAKKRLAHYDADGGYVEQVVVGPELLIDGEFFSYQLPRVLADGTVLAFSVSLDGSSTTVLRVRSGQADAVVLDGAVNVVADDGERLYGFDADGNPVAVDLATRSITPVESFRGPDMTPWRVLVDRGLLSFARPDAGQARSVALVAVDPPGGPVFPQVEAAVAVDGTINLLIAGIPERDETISVGGFTTIDSEGNLGPVEPVPTLHSSAAPGSPAHLHVRPGTTEATLMFVEEEGVRVYHRDPAASADGGR